MFLEKLIIKKNSNLIREISFKKGINLIIDETKEKDKSGNNVGKTTVLRLIDFCLGSDGTNIYQDQEFKEESARVIEELLKKNNVTITLILTEELNNPKAKKIIIERNFLEKEEKIAKINGVSYNKIDEEFCPMLSNLIFDYKYDKPSFRQIISKNVRYEKNRLRNTINILHATTKSEEYETLFLFWLGIHDGDLIEKQNLERKKTIELNFQSRLKREGTISEINQALIVVEGEIKKFEADKNKNFEPKENYELHLDKLKNLKSEISRLSTKLNQLELRRTLILESKEDLEKELSKIDTEDIKEFYSEAKSLIPNLQKSFEETLNFHNSMVSERINYITEEIPQLEEQILTLKKKISALISDENRLIIEINKSNTFKDLEIIIINLNRLYEKKGNLSEKREIWNNTELNLGEINLKLDEINKKIEKNHSLIQNRISIFNKYFSNISNELYGEPFILSSDKDKKGCYTLKISSIGGNLGTGKKKGQMVAFDFAYIHFAEEIGIKLLHFILHDQIETIHDNQINTILTKIVAETNCQYVIPVLRDKLPKEIDTKGMEILSLSESDKLFKV